MKKKVLFISTFGNSEEELFKLIDKKREIIFLFYDAVRITIFKNKKKIYSKKLFYQNNRFKLSLNLIIIFFYIFFLIMKFKINFIKSKGTFVSFFVGILFKIKLIKNFDYICDDWFINKKKESSFKNYCYSFIEIFIKKKARYIFSCYDFIIKERLNFFRNKQIKIKNEILIPLYFTKINSKKINDKKNKKIIKLGSSGVFRKEFDGRELLYLSKKFKKYKNQKIKYFHYGGMKNYYYFKLIKYLNLRSYSNFKIIPFMQNKNVFLQNINSLDVGYSLVKKNSYSKNVLTSKIVTFIQCGVPIICSDTLEQASKIIRENKIGLITGGKIDDVIAKTKVIIKDKITYKKNIYLFLKKINKNKKLYTKCYLD